MQMSRLMKSARGSYQKRFVACAQHLPETENINIAAVGPASRPVDVACDAHGAAVKPAAADEEEEWEQLDEDAHGSALSLQTHSKNGKPLKQTPQRM